ncbi:hypothetical protein [Halorussus caseinilyticus]|uniref:Uncharacterized protein n=1 Tax=Halorussus caseinilyticus TaxID=3034025 RepID=A0ABD5WKS6_9EURY
MASDESDDSHERSDPEKADHYRHGGGTDEIVFAVEDGRVLAIREYPTVAAFERAVGDAEFVGVHEGSRTCRASRRSRAKRRASSQASFDNRFRPGLFCSRIRWVRVSSAGLLPTAQSARATSRMSSSNSPATTRISCRRDGTTKEL